MVIICCLRDFELYGICNSCNGNAVKGSHYFLYAGLWKQCTEIKDIACCVHVLLLNTSQLS
jgi:hypothetical protein